MNLSQWFHQLSSKGYSPVFGADLVLLDSTNNQLVTIKEDGDKVIFMFPLQFSKLTSKTYRDALTLNGRADLLGCASVGLGEQANTLLFTYSGLVYDKLDLENLWDNAVQLRNTVAGYLHLDE